MKRSNLHIVFCGEIVFLSVRISGYIQNILEESVRKSPEPQTIHANIEALMECANRIAHIVFPRNWSSKGKNDKEKFAIERADEIRKILEISSNSPLEKRSLRNHGAHFDERVDRWFCDSRSKTFGRHMIGSRKDQQRLGISDEDILACFDPQTGEYFFLEDRVNIFEIDIEVKRIALNARNYLRDNEWSRG